MNNNSKEATLKVEKIAQGTVIDHIEAGRAQKVLRILGFAGDDAKMGGDGMAPAVVIITAMNVPSKKYGRKDIVKIENRFLDAGEMNRIALISPSATINIIRNFKSVKKATVRLPDRLVGLIGCPNPNCVTCHERVDSIFDVETPSSSSSSSPSSSSPSRNPHLKLRCHYCERVVYV